MLKMSESDLVKYARSRLTYCLTWIEHDRANAGSFSITDGKTKKKRFIKGKKAGTGDIEGFFAPLGRHFEMELKVGKNTQLDSQKERQRRVESLGGLYFLCYTTQDVDAAIEAMRCEAKLHKAKPEFTPATDYLKRVVVRPV